MISKRLLQLFGAVLGVALFAGAFAGPADAFWGRRHHPAFNPDVNAPQPYDPSSPGRLGTDGGNPSDCYWSREQTYVAGRLVWRPLQVCPYPPD
ncbi:MAG: hypothetical protein AB7F96_08135 [Beijerinckiaceae bacterium]